MIVLDTHVLVWTVQNDRRLGHDARVLIDAVTSESRLLVPAFCAWEIAQIEKRQNSAFGGGALEWLNRILANPGFQLAPLLPDIAIGSVMLDWSHSDPADRIIVATAQHHRVPLLTADSKILSYAAAGHVEAINARH